MEIGWPECVAEADHSEESCTKLGNFKRAAVERVENRTPAIWHAVVPPTGLLTVLPCGTQLDQKEIGGLS